MTNITYIRVSTSEQSTARQEEMFKIGINKYYVEKVLGKNIKDRHELIKMIVNVK